MIGKTADVTKFIEPDAGFTQSGKANEIPSKAALVNHWKPLAAAKTASRPIVKLVKNHANNNWMTKITPTERQWMCLRSRENKYATPRNTKIPRMFINNSIATLLEGYLCKTT